MKFLNVLLLLLISSCMSVSDDSGELTKNEKALSILEKKGFDISAARFIDDHLIVEGDIAFRVGHILSENFKRKKGRLNKDGKVDINRINKIYIKFDNSVSVYWRKVVKLAIKDWNNIRLYEKSFVDGRLHYGYRRSKIYLSTNWAYRGDGNIITVYTKDRPESESDPKSGDRSRFMKRKVLAYASFPENGRVGEQITIYRDIESDNIEDNIRTVIHEIGHTLGFSHVDKHYSSSSQIAGTGNYQVKQYKSIMHSIASSTILKLQYDDKLSAIKLYKGLFIPVKTSWR